MSSGATLRNLEVVRHAGHVRGPYRAARGRAERCRVLPRATERNRTVKLTTLPTSPAVSPEQFIFIDRRETSIPVRKVKNQSLYKKSAKVCKIMQTAKVWLLGSLQTCNVFKLGFESTCKGSVGRFV